MNLTPRQLATVLAALRCYQHCYGLGNMDPEHAAFLREIATDCGAFSPMTNSEIDTFFDQLNFGDCLNSDTIPDCDAPTGEDARPATPPLEELRILLNAAAYWADGEADEDHPDPLSEVCDCAREANELFNRIFPETPGHPVDIHKMLSEYDPATEPTPWYRNHYKCPCGHEWQDEHDCMCNDRCSACGKEIEPHHSDDLTDE
jgi:hypothetical protein